MNKYKLILIIFILISGYTNVKAQKDRIDIKGTIVSSYGNKPLSNAIISVEGIDDIIYSDEKGQFIINNISGKSILNIWCPGFYIKDEPIANRENLRIVLIPEDMQGYSDKKGMPNQGTIHLSGQNSNIDRRASCRERVYVLV